MRLALLALAHHRAAAPLPSACPCGAQNKKLGKQTDMRNMDSNTVAQMMQKMNPQMLQHLGGVAGLDAMMKEMEKEEKKLGK